MNGVVLLRDALNSTLGVFGGTQNRTLGAKRGLSIYGLLSGIGGFSSGYRIDLRINGLPENIEQ